ncbi:hypothetical protein QYF61_000030 [Mycteria americana]|uniref:Uncharacterized protein n=1 Tax=Mycteria americana TaxID=33587 RepID=A0AAN7P1D3_MYCAM|nr:hypothetical protein QYF61_000030 [Mycteria americana]
MLAGLDPLVILYMPCDGTQDDLLHQLPRHRATPSQGTNSVFSKSTTNFGLLEKSALEDLGDVSVAMPPEMMLNNPSSLSHSSSDLCSRPFTSFIALLWTRSSTSMSLL